MHIIDSNDWNSMAIRKSNKRIFYWNKWSKRLNEQQTWCITPVSKTQEVDGKEGKCEVEKREKLPLKLEINESGC